MSGRRFQSLSRLEGPCMHSARPGIKRAQHLLAQAPRAQPHLLAQQQAVQPTPLAAPPAAAACSSCPWQAPQWLACLQSLRGSNPLGGSASGAGLLLRQSGPTWLPRSLLSQAAMDLTNSVAGPAELLPGSLQAPGQQARVREMKRAMRAAERNRQDNWARMADCFDPQVAEMVRWPLQINYSLNRRRKEGSTLQPCPSCTVGKTGMHGQIRKQSQPQLLMLGQVTLQEVVGLPPD